MSTIPLQPAAPDDATAARWKETARRRRMLDGLHRDDVRTRVREHLSCTREQAMGVVGLSSNIFRMISRELSSLYVTAPTRYHPDPLGMELISKIAPKLDPMLPRFQAWVLGCREYLLRISVDGDGDLVFRPVGPDLIANEKVSPDDPTELVALDEYHLRRLGDDYRWCVSRFDLTDPENPIWRVIDVDDNADITALMTSSASCTESSHWKSSCR